MHSDIVVREGHDLSTCRINATVAGPRWALTEPRDHPNSVVVRDTGGRGATAVVDH
jgi:hypothetical protein